MTSKLTPEHLREVISQFQIDGEVLSAEPYGSGHINDTICSVIDTGPGQTRRYIHQRINQTIFQNVDALMENISRVTNHLRGKFLAAGEDPDRRTLTLVPTRHGETYLRHGDECWRTYIFIEGARTYDTVEKPSDVYHASQAFGEFQCLLADLPAPELHETIPHFGEPHYRFKQFRDALDADTAGRAKDCPAEIDFLLAREDDMNLLHRLTESGELPRRVAHYDTKFNNVMIDDETGRGICVIDLDTVMTGTALYDFGDSARITTSTAPEDEPDLSKVNLNLEMFEQLARGYLDTAGDFLTSVERENLAASARLITLTIGSRFLADFLNGDTYFKVHRPGHNLDRCRTQFKMAREMEANLDKMNAIVAAC